MTLIAFASAIVGAVLGAYLQKIWTPNPSKEIVLLRQEVADFQQRIEGLETARRAEKQQDASWFMRFENVASQLLRINPFLRVQEPDVKVETWVYMTIFPSADDRKAVETYIVQLHPSGTQFLRRTPSPEELRLPTMRKTIERAETLLQEFRHNHPGAAHHLG
jgi:hypothetical protein